MLRTRSIRNLGIALGLVISACAEPRAVGHAPFGPGAWSVGVPLPVDRFEANASNVDGKIYFIGGITGIFGDLRSVKESLRVDVFDPKVGAWTDGPPLPAESAHHHLAVAVLDGKVYVLGGFVGVVGGDPPGVFYPIATTFVLEGTTWRRLKDQPIKRGAASAQVIDRKIYVVGGGDDENAARNDLYVYDPATDAWSQRASMPTAREHVATCATSGKLIAAGGWSQAQKLTTARAEIYDVASDTWSALPDMPTVRGGFGGVLLDGVCHFIGGENWQLPFPGTFSAHEGFDPATGRWESYAPMQSSRHGLGIALLGRSIYAVGGGPSQGNSYTNLVEVFTP